VESSAKSRETAENEAASMQEVVASMPCGAVSATPSIKPPTKILAAMMKVEVDWNTLEMNSCEEISKLIWQILKSISRH